MVQRKVSPPKLLGFQADQANNKLDKTRFRRIIGPSSPKHQDGLTKKMKKSRPITKRSDPESSSKNPKFRNEVSLPGKPPPFPPPPEQAVEATPGKQFPARRSESSPNYMKSTSSSDARKERSQVSPPKIITPPPKKSSNSSGSSHKLAKSLTKTTSLKLGRTLTKSPSFKPARSPQVVLCDDIDVQRATCSSTLKESKFPSYLQLSHGATESEGTSAMKICPYTYCSLNGHRHTQHPPLKSFVSARRRMLKTQKKTKLGCLSPGRARAGVDGKREVQIKQIILDDKPDIEEIDHHLIPDGFLIEIYMKSGAEETSSSSTNLAEELEFGDRVGQDITEGVSSKEEEIAEEDLCNHNDHFEEEFSTEAEGDGSEHENCDMEWEEGQYSAQSPNGGEENLETDSCSGDYDYDLDLGKFSFGFDEIPSHEGPQEISEDEGRAGSESHGSIQIWGRGGEDYAVGRSSGKETDERSELDDFEGKSITLAPTPVEDAQEDETEELDDAENICPIRIGEGITLLEKEDCELNHGDSTEQQNDGKYDDDYSSSDSSEVYQFEAEGDEASVAESQLDKIDDLENKQALLAVADDDDNMEKRQDESVELLTGVTEAELDMSLADNNLTDETEANSFDKRSLKEAIVEDLDESGLNHVNLSQDKTGDDKEEMEVEYPAILEPEGSSPPAENAFTRCKIPFVRGVRKPDKEQPNVSINLRITKGMRFEEELEDPRKFNPREPNYLPVKSDPEGEKVDLKHQTMDERKDSQEWMVDYVLRQTVDKLATARKRKVALLVEAFEKVTPVPKYQQSHLRHTPSAFAHTRIVQACS